MAALRKLTPRPDGLPLWMTPLYFRALVATVIVIVGGVSFPSWTARRWGWAVEAADVG